MIHPLGLGVPTLALDLQPAYLTAKINDSTKTWPRLWCQIISVELRKSTFICASDAPKLLEETRTGGQNGCHSLTHSRTLSHTLHIVLLLPPNLRIINQNRDAT